MRKIFLSHRSKDKFIVANVANKLGANYVHYDAVSFEISSETLKEIESRIENTDIFVYFISENTFVKIGDIDWVKVEFELAEELHRKYQIRAFLPIVIDRNIHHTDPRIPDWVKERYNLQYVGSWDKIVRMIKTKVLENVCDLFPDVRKRYQRFVGRNEYVDQIEKNLWSHAGSSPVALIGSGINRVGRKALLFHTLIKTGIINSFVFQPATIEMFRGEAIDDFILKIAELGYTQMSLSAVNLPTGADEKIDLLCSLLEEVRRSRDIIVVNDFGSLINTTNELSDWFVATLKRIESFGSVVLLIASQFRLDNYHDANRQLPLFYLHVRPFESDDKYKLFNALLQNSNRNLTLEQKRVVLGMFTGFPEQIIRTVEQLEENGFDWVIANSFVITEYSSALIERDISHFLDEELDLLRFLAEFECVTITTLHLVIDLSSVSAWIKKFLSLGICIYSGSQNELLQVERVVRDYITRKKRNLSASYRIAVEKIVSLFLEEESGLNISEYYVGATYYVLQTKYSEMDSSRILPSTYIKAIIEMYNKTRNRYADIVDLAYSVLDNVNLDRIQVQEIRYWLCMALAKSRDVRFHDEVMKVSGPEHDYVFGFYYRIVGKNIDAETRLKRALDQRKSFPKAKSELVHVYMNMEEFESALALAKELYEQSPNNVYSINTFFSTHLRAEAVVDRILLQRLIDKLRSTDSVVSREMYFNCLAQYLAFVEQDFVGALETVARGLVESEKTIYLKLTEVEILIKSKEPTKALERLYQIESEDYSRSYINNTLQIKKAQLKGILGQVAEAVEIIDRNQNLPPEVKRRLKEKFGLFPGRF